MQACATRYFQGANSTQGFSSLYDSLVKSGEGERRFLIKAGPGGGKSSFMRFLGHSLASDGQEVEYIHCSGDPDSLDGIVLPDAKVAVLDATAPHVVEPVGFGSLDNYLNLGRFCRSAALYEKREEITSLTQAYREEYRQAYAYLAAFGALPRPRERGSQEHLADCVQALPRVQMGKGRVLRRFLRAFTWKGWIDWRETALRCADLSLRVSSGQREQLNSAAELAARLGYRVILEMDPLFPALPASLLIPEAGMAFVAADLPGPEHPEIGNALLDMAEWHLKNAKARHDKLEAVYHPYIDFQGLGDYGAAFLEELKQLAQKA